jgi:hypothetical protein
MSSRGLRSFAALVALALVVFGALPSRAAAPGNDAFMRTWARTDKPVADGMVARSWMWGPDAFTTVLDEPYAESPSGMRRVQYFDKSRMEITVPDGDQSSPWYVTNGLLAVELISGRLQLGDAAVEERAPAAIGIAGDPADASGPTYATFSSLLDAAPLAAGTTVTQRVTRDGTVSGDAALAAYGVRIAEVDAVTNHAYPDVFRAFLAAEGLVYEDGTYATGTITDGIYATGRPITEAYWATVIVDGAVRDVLVQCYERRCLTYAPSNEPAWRIEMGNIGRHYFQWRYLDVAPGPEPDPAPPSDPSPPADAPACDPAYPDVCVPPPPPDLDCSDIGARDFTVLSPDPHGFDTDGDGIGCERTDDGGDDGGDTPGTRPSPCDPGRAGDCGAPEATKIIDTNVPGALACVYAAGDVGQDGKPDPAAATAEDCELLLVSEKGGTPGQGEPAGYFANLGGDGAVADITYDDETNELTAAAQLRDLDLDEGDEVTVGIFGGGCFVNDPADADCDDEGDGDVFVAADNAVCPPAGLDIAGAAGYIGLEKFTIGTAEVDAAGDVVVSNAWILTAAEDELLGDPQTNVVVAYDATGDIIACGLVEPGTARLETFEEAAARLGAVVVGQTDPDGDVAFGLDAGDYVAVITAPGYDVAVEGFTLELGEVEVNEVTLTP